jgi:hypothetical protein
MREYKSILKNSESIGQMAQEQVDSWDHKDLRYYAISKMEDYYHTISDEEFDEEFKEWFVAGDE